ncbi:MAG: DUF3570 domain-containing protein [Methylococcaceae bacterium]|nr:DUF3570 domain-containing protein [Methylococcaceae bacterium]
MMTQTIKHEQKTRTPASLSALTAAALVMPGLLQTLAHAADDDSVDFQYSHYQEGKRDSYGPVIDAATLTSNVQKLPQNLNPIEVDSIHGSAKITLTDRIKFAFNYTQDTWAGATPVGTAPVLAGGNFPLPRGYYNSNAAVTGASPFLDKSDTGFLSNPNASAFYTFVQDEFGNLRPVKLNNQLTHVLSYASPETRQQGDFKLSYAWSDEVAFDLGGGISVENDYESRFGSLGGRIDFNQKQTTVNWGVSYTNSDTNAQLDPDALGFYHSDQYDNSFIETNPIDNSRKISVKPPVTASGEVEVSYDELFSATAKTLRGNRQDWGVQLGLSQVLNRNALVSLDFGYTRSTGYLANPYKMVYLFAQIPESLTPDGLFSTNSVEGGAFLETRPDERNLFNWHVGYDQFVEPLDAALHFDYSFAHDDWGINAHTFEADWVQPLGWGWTITPRIRYYSQSAADFYTTGLFVLTSSADESFPQQRYYSSDQRLSGFGTLSGGVTVEKQFAKGVSLQTGFEYYTHQGSLKLGGGGEGDYADFDYWVANAALKVNLAALTLPGSGHDGHGEHHHHHSNTPAGIQYDHVLPKAGDFMVGYSYMRNVQAGDFRLGDRMIGIDQARKEGCYGEECAVTPNNMTMNMHMLDLMYAPTDWLTLMLMPQWTDMDMTMTPNPDFIPPPGGHGGHSGAVHEHQTGGIGDFGLYGLFKLYGDDHHKVNLALGGTAPTGDVDIVQRKTFINNIFNNPLHYCMQLGSGTWDFKPALTYTGQADKFSWGAQANATIRLEGQNKSGFAFGDIFQGTAWGGYQWAEWLGTTVRGVFTSQGEIRGRYPTIYVPLDDTNPTGPQVPFVDQHIDTFGQPENYGGSFADLGLGINVNIPHGTFAGNSLKFEWLQPVYTNFNGYQPDRDYALNFTWSYGF